MRVLVVEDEKRLAEAVRNGLEQEGFAVDLALNGDEGLWTDLACGVRVERRQGQDVGGCAARRAGYPGGNST